MTTEIDLGMIGDQMKATQVKYIKNYQEFTEKFLLNPFNPRDLSQQEIYITMDEAGDTYLRLKPSVVCSPEYRKAFNELIDSLATVETIKDGNDLVHKVSYNVTNMARVTPFENGMATKGHIFLSANTRYNILKQVFELVGKDNVEFSFPYIIDTNNYDPENPLPCLLTAGQVDNTGITISADSKTNIETLERAFNSLDMETDDEKFEWIRSNLVYGKQHEKKAPKVIPASLVTKWSVPKKYPKIVEAIESLVSLEFQANFINQIYLTNLDKFNSSEECLTTLVKLLQDYVGNVLTKTNKIATYSNYDGFKKYVDAYFNPPEPIQNSESVNESTEENQETESTNQLKTGKDLLDYVSLVNDNYTVAVGYDFGLLDEETQKQVSKIMFTIQNQINKLMKLTEPKNEPESETQKKPKKGKKAKEQTQESEPVIEVVEVTEEDTEALEVISQ